MALQPSGAGSLGVTTMFLYGDSDEAKAQFSAMVQQSGWEPYDCGGMVSARALEPLCMLGIGDRRQESALPPVGPD